MKFITQLAGIMLPCILLLLPNTLRAQDGLEEPISLSEAAAYTVFEQDSTASAVVLYDIQTTDFQQYSDLNLVFIRKLRVKILTSDGLNYGDFRIPYRKGSTRVVNIKGTTYSPNDNGGLTPITLEKSAITDTKYQGKVHMINIVMPQIKVGAVFDLEYQIFTSNPALMEDFTIQHNIPTVYTRYITKIPDYYTYSIIKQGQVPLSKQDQLVVENGNHFNSTHPYNFLYYDFEAENVPAFVKEPFSPAERNTRGAIEFQLSGFTFPGQRPQGHLTDWSNYGKWLESTSSWKAAYGKQRVIKGMIPENIKKLAGLEQVQALFKWVQSTFRWDESYSFEPDYKARKFDGSQPGNIADINLALVNALQALGHKALPLVYSTRSHGIITTTTPIISQFNAILAWVKVDGREYFLNAAPHDLPFGVLSPEDYTGYGALIEGKFTKIILLAPKARFHWEHNGRISFDTTSQQFTSKWEVELKDASRSFTITEEWLKENWQLEDISLLETIPTKPHVWSFSSTYSADAVGDGFLIPMGVDTRLTESPFIAETRKHPLFFALPRRYDYTLRLEVPKGYSVEDLPETLTQALPQNLGMFFFSAKKEGGEVVWQMSLRIKQPILDAALYPQMREMYAKMVEVATGQLYLSKIED